MQQVVLIGRRADLSNFKLFFYFIQTVEFDGAQSPECVLIFEKKRKKVNLFGTFDLGFQTTLGGPKRTL